MRLTTAEQCRLRGLSGISACCRELIGTNPDNTKYHDALLQAMGLIASAGGSWNQEERAKLSSLYHELQEAYPRSLACKRVPLDFKVRRGL